MPTRPRGSTGGYHHPYPGPIEDRKSAAGEPTCRTLTSHQGFGRPLGELIALLERLFHRLIRGGGTPTCEFQHRFAIATALRGEFVRNSPGSATTVQPGPPAPSPIEARVGQARALVQKREYAAALAAAQTLPTEVPENRDVLYLIAVCQR